MPDKQAMVLAAGFGTRLKPYSLLRPKPLFPVLDTPLIFHTLYQLRKAGFKKITVNAHHLKEQFIHLLHDEKDIMLQLEDVELGTGGGLRLAYGNFSRNPVLITNGDIYHSIELNKVFDQHCRSGEKITLVLHDFPRFNNVLVDETNYVVSFGNENNKDREKIRKLAFTGIHVVDPDILQIMPKGQFYNIIDCYRLWMREGVNIKALVVDGHYWTDMGTPGDYLKLHEYLLTGKDNDGASSFYLGEDVNLSDNVQFKDWVCIGSNATIGRGSSLNRVVVWDGVEVPMGTNLSDAIIYA